MRTKSMRAVDDDEISVVAPFYSISLRLNSLNSRYNFNWFSSLADVQNDNMSSHHRCYLRSHADHADANIAALQFWILFLNIIRMQNESAFWHPIVVTRRTMMRPKLLHFSLSTALLLQANMINIRIHVTKFVTSERFHTQYSITRTEPYGLICLSINLGYGHFKLK